MFVTATELKNNMGKYLDLATKEDIIMDYIITRNVKDFSNSPVPPITPENFNSLFPI